MIRKNLNYDLVMVTNQDGLGTVSFPEEKFWPAHNKMLIAFSNEGIDFDDILIDKSFPEDNSPNRKPRTGMLKKYMEGDYDLAESFVIGDRLTDIELAKNIGAKGILLNDGSLSGELEEKGLTDNCVLISEDWQDIYNCVAAPERKMEVRRKTKETDVLVVLNLDGSGVNTICTGLNFFDHMLDQIGRHARVDLSIKVEGDLQVDEHHTIEDTALALGEAVRKALGDKKGINRYGFCLPMDDSRAEVAVDFGGRPYMVWEAEFNREKVGDMPTEMFRHFFKSFSDAALCNCYFIAGGENEHHKIEAIFKSFAKALGMALRREPGNFMLPSTKGSL